MLIDGIYGSSVGFRGDALVELETLSKSRDNDPENMFKECLDMLVVIIGYCATYGWDVDEGFRRVHASNMSKLGLDGKPLKNSSGKVLKGPNYKPAILTDLVETNNEQ